MSRKSLFLWSSLLSIHLLSVALSINLYSVQAQSTPPSQLSASPQSVNLSNKSTQSNKNENDHTPLILGGLALFISLLGTGFSTYILSLQNKKAKSLQNKLNQQVLNSNSIFNTIQQNLSQVQQLLAESDKKIDKARRQIKDVQVSFFNQSESICSQFKELQKAINILSYQQQWERQTQYINQTMQGVETQSVIAPAQVSQELTELIHQFNQENRDYFQNQRFCPLTLTPESIRGEISSNARKIVHFQSPLDNSPVSYLMININKENWLIPNIVSPYVAQIMHNLAESPEIFTVHLGSGRLKLVRPAKLKQVNTGLWEIEEPGSFSAV